MLGFLGSDPQDKILDQTYCKKTVSGPGCILPPLGASSAPRRQRLSDELAWVEAPAVDLLLLPFLGQQDHPLLPRRLLEVGVSVPSPQQRPGRQQLLAPHGLLVREPISDAHDAPRDPDELLLALGAILDRVGPEDLEPLTRTVAT